MVGAVGVVRVIEVVRLVEVVGVVREVGVIRVVEMVGVVTMVEVVWVVEVVGVVVSYLSENPPLNPFPDQSATRLVKSSVKKYVLEVACICKYAKPTKIIHKVFGLFYFRTDR